MPQAKCSFAYFQGSAAEIAGIIADFEEKKTYAATLDARESNILDSREHLTYALSESANGDGFRVLRFNAAGGDAFDLVVERAFTDVEDLEPGEWFWAAAPDQTELKAVYLEESPGARAIPKRYAPYISYCRAIFDTLEALAPAFGPIGAKNDPGHAGLPTALPPRRRFSGEYAGDSPEMRSSGDLRAAPCFEEWFALEDEVESELGGSIEEDVLSLQDALNHHQAALSEDQAMQGPELAGRYRRLAQAAAYAGNWNIFLRAHLAQLSESARADDSESRVCCERSNLSTLSALGVRTDLLAPGLLFQARRGPGFAGWEASVISPQALAAWPESGAAVVPLAEAALDERLDIFNRYNILKYYCVYLLSAYRQGRPVNGDIDQLLAKKQELPTALRLELEVLERHYRQASRAGQ